MANKTVTLKGLRANYSQDYKAGEVIYRKYRKEWKIFAEYEVWGSKRVAECRNSIEYVNNNADLLEALKKACKPVTTINDKVDNPRIGLGQIQVTVDERGNIVGHKLLTKTPEEIATSAELVKERKEQLSKLPSFAMFLNKPN